MGSKNLQKSASPRQAQSGTFTLHEKPIKFHISFSQQQSACVIQQNSVARNTETIV